MAISETEAWRIGRLDAHDQAALLAEGEVSAPDLVEAAITRIDRLDPLLNVITHRAFERARERAVGVAGTAELRGIPCLLKEGLDYPGMPTRCGSRSKVASPNVTVEYEYTRRLDAAGLIPLGKTNASEFGLLPTTEPLLYGPTRNPWALSRSPGGSSGGAAAAVASGMVPLAHAADGGGSIRIPASCCGVFGLKPGRGASVRARQHSVIEDFLVADTLLSRSVRDAAWAFSIARPDGTQVTETNQSAKALRIGLAIRNLLGDLPDPEVARVTRNAAAACADLGHRVEEVDLPIDGISVASGFRTIWGYLARDVVDRCPRESSLQNLLEPWTLGLAEWSRQFGPLDVERTFADFHRASACLSSFFERYDVFLSPVLNAPPVEIGRLGPTRPFEVLLSEMFAYVSYTPLQNATGTPAMSVPLFASSAGLPIGSMFTAARGDEEVLLRLAYELEAAYPWENRWPPSASAARSVALDPVEGKPIATTHG